MLCKPNKVQNCAVSLNYNKNAKDICELGVYNNIHAFSCLASSESNLSNLSGWTKVNLIWGLVLNLSLSLYEKNDPCCAYVWSNCSSYFPMGGTV